MLQLSRVEIIVFDGISRTIHHQVFEARNLLQRFQLNLHRQGRRESVQVKFTGSFSLRLQEKLVLGFVGERHNFGFDTWAVARSDTLDLSVEKGRVGQSFPQGGMYILVGEARPTLQLFQVARFADE